MRTNKLSYFKSAAMDSRATSSGNDIILKDGVRYLCKNGDIVVVRRMNVHPAEYYQFVDNNRYLRSTDGRIFIDRASELDIVSEVHTNISGL